MHTGFTVTLTTICTLVSPSAWPRYAHWFHLHLDLVMRTLVSLSPWPRHTRWYHRHLDIPHVIYFTIILTSLCTLADRNLDLGKHIGFTVTLTSSRTSISPSSWPRYALWFLPSPWPRQTRSFHRHLDLVTYVDFPVILTSLFNSVQIQNTLLSVAIITIKRKFFFAHTSSATLTI